MTSRSALVLGVFILLAAVVHVGASRLVPGAQAKPMLVGRVQGDIFYRIDANTTGRHQVSGCKLECYENMVAVYVDKSIATTWTTDNVLLIPWRQIDSITLMASSPDNDASH